MIKLVLAVDCRYFGHKYLWVRILQSEPMNIFNHLLDNRNRTQKWDESPC